MYLLIALPFALIVLSVLKTEIKIAERLLPYAVFFIAPALTYFGVIGVLTGFDGKSSTGLFVGITFYTVFAARLISRNRQDICNNPRWFVISIINPIYLFTGPIPNGIFIPVGKMSLYKLLRRFRIIHNDLIVGVLFSMIIAPSIANLLYIKNSTNVIDVLFFGLIFELYVYYNFCGFSMIAWSIMRLIGVKVNRNFNQPFGANSLVEYWQRWHISLSDALKQLFFKQLRPVFGIYFSVIVVFFASAFWHGLTANFILWGCFHSLLWCCAHVFYKKDFRVLNYLLLVLGVLVGRVIFSENDVSFLMSKLGSIIDPASWVLESQIIFTLGTIRDQINLVIAAILVLLEVILPRVGYVHKKYEHLKSPAVSALVATYICLAFSGVNGAPVYGNR